MKPLLLATLLFCTSVGSAIAQDFYGKDYAKSPLEEKKREQHKDTQPEISGNTEKNGSAQNSSALEQEGPRVLAVSLIVNGVQRAHAVEKISELVDVAVQRGVLAKTVYLIGNSIQQANIQEELLKKGSFGSYYFQLMEAFKPLSSPPTSSVKVSPTWVVETEKGTYLLEGLGPLRKFISEKNTLKLPEGVK